MPAGSKYATTKVMMTDEIKSVALYHRDHTHLHELLSVNDSLKVTHV